MKGLKAVTPARRSRNVDAVLDVCSPMHRDKAICSCISTMLAERAVDRPEKPECPYCKPWLAVKAVINSRHLDLWRYYCLSVMFVQQLPHPPEDPSHGGVLNGQLKEQVLVRVLNVFI